MPRSHKRVLDENDMLDELPGGSKDAGRMARDATPRREKREERRENERISISIAMRSSSVPGIARSA
jgi:hypothetical protein